MIDGLTTFERLRVLINDHFGVPLAEITESASFVDELGFDSLDEIEMIMAVEEAFGIEINDHAPEVGRIFTVRQAVAHIDDLLAQVA